MGFEINPYDPCVANKMINGTQMTIRWHADDLMISHLSQDKIMKVVQEIKDIYGENLVETVGTVHDYLGMTFDYSFTREVRINIKDFPKEITGTCTTPASDHLLRCVRTEGSCLKSWQMFSITWYTSSFLQQTEHGVISKPLYRSSLLECRHQMKTIGESWYRY